MSTRLKSGGRRIDRSRPVTFSFDGARLRGYRGDTLASALLANDRMLVGRSFKYHRPRGIVASGSEEPNALVGLEEGDLFEPNQRATTTELYDGLTARSQNRWPSLSMDFGAVTSRLSRVLPAGFYYKTFLRPRSFWKHVYEPLIRRSAGLGYAPNPEARDPDRYEHFYLHVDVLIVGGGIAGIQSALAAGRAGARVLLIEQSAHWGGRSPADHSGGKQSVNNIPVDKYVDECLAELGTMPHVQCRTRTMGAGVYDHGYVLAYERVGDHLPGEGALRHRLWKIRTGRIITATGAIERPIAFPGNDLPGVMLASAARDYLIDFGVSMGKHPLVLANNDSAYETAFLLQDQGVDVAAIVDARTGDAGGVAQEAVERGLRVIRGGGVSSVKGRRRVEGVTICDQRGAGTALEEISCDAIAMSGGWSPAVHLWSHSGGKLTWDARQFCFRPDVDNSARGADGAPYVIAAGAASGEMTLAAAVKDGHAAGLRAAAELGYNGAAQSEPVATRVEEAAIEPVWIMPSQAPVTLREKAFLDFQNDVKVSDVELAAREGFESVEHAKRYTTLGMATDQGKLSNINGIAILSDALGRPIPQTGTTTFRPPYTPISFGSIAGSQTGPRFLPIRRTPIQDWHEEQGAYFEPVGHWRRPYCYPRGDESHSDAVAREILQTRNHVGLLDASTLGKIVVKGPDAGRLLDMLYTGRMSTLKPGRCRYGLMCSENGFLMDDGVVARLDEETFLCHTTTGGADHIHAHMEDWLQTEWWDWKVYTANLTEQFAQIAVVGPKSREVLERLGGMNLGRDALPFMGWCEGMLAGISARIFRISFSGELSYEIAVAADQGIELWEKFLAAGQDFGISPYGTEALHVMRAEKGFIMIGDETDGTVIPQDLGLDWAIAKGKDDYIGKRAQMRSHMIDPDRWKLVGLETVDGSVLPEGAYAVASGKTSIGQRATQGRVTSSYHSPTLGRGIAMGLVLRGPERMGDELEFPGTDGQVYKARLVSPVFYNPEGTKQDA